MLPRVARWALGIALLTIVAALLFLAGRGSRLPRVTEEDVRSAITATVQREARESFLVTGRLDLVASASVENNKVFLPDLLDLSVGRASSTVRAPGRVWYGFDVRAITPDMIRLVNDSTIRVELPPLRVQAVEPQLDRMEIDTDVSWSRSDQVGRDVERRALVLVQAALRAQGTAHLRDSTQPRVNTAEALRHMLEPTVRALGIERPNFEFDLAPGIRMETGETGSARQAPRARQAPPD